MQHPMRYSAVSPLSSVQHHDCCVETGTDYAFSRSVSSVPLSTLEFPQAASEYVIVFVAGADAVTPAAVLGIRENENLYLDAHNAWQAAYIPAYLRRYPFIFSSVDKGKTIMLCIDDAFQGLNRRGNGQPLFEAQRKPTAFLENVLKSLRDDHVNDQRTRVFCNTLQALGILDPIHVNTTLAAGEDVRLSGIMAVNRERLRRLPGSVLARLVRTDELELIYLHLLSMRNFEALRSRSLSRIADASVARAPAPNRNAATKSDGRMVRRGAATEAEDAQESSRRGVHRQGSSKGNASQISPCATPYNQEFIFRECGFDWVPEYVDRNLLFNVSYDLQNDEVKLYVLARSRDFMYKISANAIVKQYDALMHGADPSRLSQFLGADFDYQDILLDTVEDGVYYLFVEDSTAAQYRKFFRTLCDKFGVTEGRLLSAVNRINRRHSDNLDECSARKAVSLVKVPLLDAGCKVYSRPFLTGNDYELSSKTITFLTRLYDCEEKSLRAHVRHLWVASELHSDRIVISTQHHELVHGA